MIYGITQLVRQVIQPKLVGDSIGLSPLVTLVLLYVGYRIGSIFGMILAVSGWNDCIQFVSKQELLTIFWMM